MGWGYSNSNSLDIKKQFGSFFVTVGGLPETNPELSNIMLVFFFFSSYLFSYCFLSACDLCGLNLRVFMNQARPVRVEPGRVNQSVENPGRAG